MLTRNIYPSVVSYINKRYLKLEICSITTARIYVYDIKYPMIIQWSKLKKLGAIIDFRKDNKKEWLVIYLPLREVLDLVNHHELCAFVTKYINY